MNLWNVKKLHMPPINTYRAEDSNIDIYHLNKVFRDGIKFFENGKYMNAEFAILSRIVYRMKQKFRSAKDFKALEKVHKAVENFVKINFSSDLTNFMKLIPTRYREDTYLPNKNLVDYFLVRLQGLVKLMERIVDSCKIAAYLFDRRMQTGHFWKVGIIIFSIVSRLYVLAKYNAKFMCEFYGKVLPFSRQLKNNGRNWLPNNYILPPDLQKWMNVDWLDIDDEIQFVDTVDLSSVTQLLDLVDDDDIEFCNEYIMVNDDEEDVELISNFKSRSKKKPIQKVHEIRGFDTEDIGEIIDINDEVVDVNDSTYPDQSDPRERENQSIYTSICDQGDTSDFGEVIKVDSTLQTSSDGNSGNEVIILDSSLPISKDKDDVGEVIELNSSSVLFNENLSQNDDTNEIITILDSSLDSSSTKIRCIYSSTPLSQPNKNKQSKAAKKKKKSKQKSLLSKTNNKSTNENFRNSSVLSGTISSCDKENFATTSKRDREKNHLKNMNGKLVSNSGLTEQSKNKSLKDCSGKKNDNKGKQKPKNKVRKGMKSEKVQSHDGKKRKLEYDSEKSFKKLKNTMNATREYTSTKKKKSDLWQSTVISNSELQNYKSDMGKPKFGTPNREVDNGLNHHVKKNQTNCISKKKKSKSLKNKIKLAQQHNGIKNIVNKIGYSTQELRRNGKKKRKNKQNRHK